MPTGIALQQVFDNRTNRTLDFNLLSRNIASAVPGSTAVALNSIAFALLLGSLKPKSVAEAFKRVGIDDRDFWDKVGRRPEMQKFFNLKNVRETSKNTQEFLTTAIKRRNVIVHKGEGFAPVSESDVSECVEFFKSLKSAIAEIISAAL